MPEEHFTQRAEAMKHEHAELDADTDAEFFKEHGELKGRHLDGSPQDAALRAEWLSDREKTADHETDRELMLRAASARAGHEDGHWIHDRKLDAHDPADAGARENWNDIHDQIRSGAAEKHPYEIGDPNWNVSGVEGFKHDAHTASYLVGDSLDIYSTPDFHQAPAAAQTEPAPAAPLIDIPPELTLHPESNSSYAEPEVDPGMWQPGADM